MWGAGAVGGAVYTRASITCNWAGAVMRKLPAEYRCDGRTDGPTEGPSGRRTDRMTYRVTRTRLKRKSVKMRNVKLDQFAILIT